MEFSTLLLLILIIPNYAVNMKNTESYDINITDMKQCGGETYPLTVSQVSIKIINKTILLTGTLSTMEDLSSPLQAKLKIEKNELGLWVEVPCLKKLGSCTYPDLCEFGTPVDEPCPRIFTENQVPCRCPIPQGNYTMEPTFLLPIASHFQHARIVTGKYWANITIEHYNHILSCYEVYFNIKRTQNVKNKFLPSVNMI